jgi:glycine cleavage system H protein
MEVFENLFYTKEHEWVSLEDSVAVVGITDYAQGALGDVTFIELPKVGREVEQFEQCVAVESVKAASDVYSPLSGKIIEINEELENNPGLINQSCYQDGWIIKLEPADLNEKEKLMSAEKYKIYVKTLEEKD